MCERRSIHVFLGAPPPPPPLPPSPPSHPSTVTEPVGGVRPPAGWRHLELTWMGGRLRPVPGGSSRDTDDSPLRSRVQTDPTRPELDQASAAADWTTEAPPEPEQTHCDMNREVQVEPDQSDPCSASLQYLDQCFPAAQPRPEQPGPEQPGPDQPGSSPQASAAVPHLCTTSQFISTWTLSQALILQGSQSAGSPAKTPPPPPTSVSSSTPELFSPASPSLDSSAELFSPTRSPQSEGGVVLQVTPDGGVLCSQEAASPASPARPSPEPKKARLSAEAPPGVRAPTTTALVQCRTPGVRYSVLVAVVHPCHLKEVKVKSGPSAGSSVPLASIVVTDQSAAETKVVLWRRAAFWVLTVNPGDLLLITALQVTEDRWRGETLLQTSFSSKLLNLGPISASPAAGQCVDALSLRSLCVFLQERRPLLASVSHRAPQDLTRLPYATLRSLRVNTLVHALLRVTHTHISTEWRSEAESRYRSARQLKAVLTVEQPDGHQGALVLWSAAVDWLPRFNRDRAAVWDFRFLLVRDGLTSDLPELHSTPWSSVRALDPTDPRVRYFLALSPNRTGSGGAVELDVETLLSQRYSGEAELSVHVTSFHFLDAPSSSSSSQNAPGLLLDGSTQLAVVLETLSGDVTYSGCGRCAAELATDANGIYGPCYPCLPCTAVRRYYRPGVLTVSGRGHGHMCVQVPPLPLEKILNAPPDKLHRSSAPGSEMKYIQVAAERLLSLVALPKKSVSVRSHFLCDENSAIISQDFTLLDLRFPDEGATNTSGAN